MRAIPTEFNQALENKDYDLLKNVLMSMPYEKYWPAITLQYMYYNRIDITQYSECNCWSQCSCRPEPEEWITTYTTTSRDLLITDWTPLAIAAHNVDEKAIALVLNRWPNNNLVKKSYQALDIPLNYGDKYITTHRCDSRSAPLLTLDALAKIKSSKQLLLYHAERIIPNFHFDYSKKDKQEMGDFLSEKINKIDSADDLISFYKSHINKNYVSYHRHKVSSLFSFFTEKYPNSKIRFIQLLQERALVLLRLNHEERNLQKECSALLDSDIFAKKHYSHGVSSRNIKETIRYILCNPSKEDGIKNNAFVIKQ